MRVCVFLHDHICNTLVSCDHTLKTILATILYLLYFDLTNNYPQVSKSILVASYLNNILYTITKAVFIQYYHTRLGHLGSASISQILIMSKSHRNNLTQTAIRVFVAVHVKAFLIHGTEKTKCQWTCTNRKLSSQPISFDMQSVQESSSQS